MPDFALRVGVRDNPKIAEEIGQLSIAWAAIEFRMFRTFRMLSGLTNPMGRAIFFSQRTTRARIELIQAIAPLVLVRRRGGGPSKDLKRLKRLLGNIGTLAGERNKYIHDPWAGFPDDKDKRAFQMRLGGSELQGKYERIHLTTIRRLTDKLERRVDAFRRFQDSIEQKLPALHERLARLPDLNLVPAGSASRS